MITSPNRSKRMKGEGRREMLKAGGIIIRKLEEGSMIVFKSHIHSFVVESEFSTKW
jgi:hypothetical protein